jgi:5-methyltetrahydrofolate--homocysteine methyltransferase
MATNEAGMPQNSDERVNNAEVLISSLQTRGVSLSDIFVDAIVFPISVDSQNGNHYFESVRILRERYGSRLHIGMGLSNISFGMPNRRLINKAFIHLALEAGIDAGLIDPIATTINAVFKLDTESTPVKLAMAMLLGNDEFCSDFIMAHRAGLLDE